MIKKHVVVLVLAAFAAGGVFAQDEPEAAVHKHQPFDVLVGLNMGLGLTPNMGDLLDAAQNGELPKGNYAFASDVGLTCDFYLFPWLSFTSGVLLHPDIYVIFDHDTKNIDRITDIIAAPLCLTIPLAVHFNIPTVEWLYAGIGLNLNIPVAPLVPVDEITSTSREIDIQGDFFVGLPIDIGFDFIKPGKGGGRFFFRINPEFHKKGAAVPIGFMWQLNNWRVYGKN